MKYFEAHYFPHSFFGLKIIKIVYFFLQFIINILLYLFSYLFAWLVIIVFICLIIIYTFIKI